MSKNLIIQALEAGIENTTELLAHHESSLGRTTPRNTRYAEELERDINNMEDCVSAVKSGYDSAKFTLASGKEMHPCESHVAIDEACDIIKHFGSTRAVGCDEVEAKAKKWMQEFFPQPDFIPQATGEEKETNTAPYIIATFYGKTKQVKVARYHNMDPGENPDKTMLIESPHDYKLLDIAPLKDERVACITMEDWREANVINRQ